MKPGVENVSRPCSPAWHRRPSVGSEGSERRLDESPPLALRTSLRTASRVAGRAGVPRVGEGASTPSEQAASPWHSMKLRRQRRSGGTADLSSLRDD